jgi:transposase
MTMAPRQGFLVSLTKAINELKSLIVVAPEHLRGQLRGQSQARQLDLISRMRTTAWAPVAHRVSVQTMLIAARIRFLSTQVAQLDPELLSLLKQHPAGPALLPRPASDRCRGAVADQLVPRWPGPHRGRLRRPRLDIAARGQQRTTDPASPQPRRRPRPEPGPAHRGHHRDALRLRDPSLRSTP